MDEKTRILAWVAVKGGSVDDSGDLLIERQTVDENGLIVDSDQEVHGANLVVNEDADWYDSDHRDIVFERAEVLLRELGYVVIPDAGGNHWTYSGGQYAAHLEIR